MAQVLWQEMGQGQWNAESAGSKPSGYVHPLALKAIQELGYSIDGLESKTVEPFLERDIDLVVTVCDNAKEACPTLPGAKQILHWPFEDPADATGTEEEQMQFFRKIRDQIKDRIRSYLSENQA